MKQDSFVFEITARCNHYCPHCYNVWKGPGEYSQAELDPGETLVMLDRMLEETGAGLVTISGGEPLLRPDLFGIIGFLQERRVKVNLISNGSLFTDEVISRLTPDRIAVFELPLLGDEAEVHDRLSGREGAFADVTLAIAGLKELGEQVVAVFVATRWNLARWRETAELAIALGVDGIMFNRFNPGGQGVGNIADLQVGPDELAAALDVAVEIRRDYEIPISCSIAMPPCLFDHQRWPELSFGFCAAGTERAYYTLDPLGNVRPCNHSPTILGNIRQSSFTSIATGGAIRDFMETIPPFCHDCALAKICQGGCKAAAQVCCGSLGEMDPFLAAYHGQAKKPGAGNGWRLSKPPGQSR